MKELTEPDERWAIFTTSDQIEWWGVEDFYNYEDGLVKYNELLKLSKELKLDKQIEQQIHFVKIINKYENILSEIMMIG